ncbi:MULTISPECIES: 2TM domain-containing protein [unclassified Simplicispira]|jgi:hypothetical protein|uniref:2TM domain-containing protein n=1 Tax=unclassified Simplicispira TaxID=2630407 RepID=UPI000D5DA948|nr:MULTISPECIES: 2TM domain-containing protein [unclassified Simplicispira]PVY55281.1 2TM domain-containing protein [Simplicispira sp. 125]REG16224.1 2TM domain-containing protein [Simplicispira sp. 110]
MAHAPSSKSDDLERLARKRAGAKLGWYAHACVYVLVNLFLAFLSSRSNYPWAVFPALGWGLGLLIHGAAVWVAMPGGSLYAQLLERERAALHRQPPL